MAEFQHHVYQLHARRLEMVTQGPNEEEAVILKDHFNYLMRLAAEGKLSLVGRTANNDETTFGLALINSADEAEARLIMDNDPAISAGIMTAELFPFRIAFPAK